MFPVSKIPNSGCCATASIASCTNFSCNGFGFTPTRTTTISAGIRLFIVLVAVIPVLFSSSTSAVCASDKDASELLTTTPSLKKVACAGTFERGCNDHPPPESTHAICMAVFFASSVCIYGIATLTFANFANLDLAPPWSLKVLSDIAASKMRFALRSFSTAVQLAQLFQRPRTLAHSMKQRPLSTRVRTS